MKKLGILAIIAGAVVLVLLGCWTIFGNRHVCKHLDGSKTEKCPVCFKAITSMCCDRDIIAFLDIYFTNGASVTMYQKILPLADKTAPVSTGTKYIFFFRGENPRHEGGHYYEVKTDSRTGHIEYHGAVGLTL